MCVCVCVVVLVIVNVIAGNNFFLMPRVIKFLCLKARKFKQKFMFKISKEVSKIRFNIITTWRPKFIKQFLRFRITNRNIVRLPRYATVATNAIHLVFSY